MESDELAHPNYQVELGWNTSPPHFQFPDTDNEVDGSLDQPSFEAMPPPLVLRSSNHENLGKYASFLPASSPPPVKARKRRTRSPQLQKKALEAGTPVKSRADETTKRTKVMPTRSMSFAELESLDEFDDSVLVLRDSPHKEDSAEIEDGGGTQENDGKLVGSPESTSEPFEVSKKKIRSLTADELADLDDIEDLFLPQTVHYQPSFFSNRRARRFVVREIDHNSAGVSLQCVTSENKEVSIELRGSWMDSEVRIGDIVHIVSSKPSDSLVVDDSVALDQQQWLIINPDILIPCTTLAQAMSCERQVVLNTQVRAPSDLNESLVLGSIKHEFIQACFTAGTGGEFSLQTMTDELRRACENNSLDLRLVESDVESAFEKLQKIIPAIQKWVREIWGKTARGVKLGDLKLRINRAVQIEEDIRSPFLGLIGKIDVTCEVSELREGSASATNRLAALEIKTGKNTQSIAHRAQTALYTLLMAERHPNNTHPWSLLYYTETAETTPVTLKAAELVALLQRRNNVARSLWYLPGRQLPEPVSATEQSCKWCSRRDSCVLYTAIEDKGDTHGSAALEITYKQEKDTGILTSRFLAFIEKWHHLLDLEYDIANRIDQLHARQWWLRNPEPRLWKVNEKLDQNPLAVGNHYSLVPANDSAVTAPLENLFECRVLVSSKQHMALNFGLVTSATDAELRLVLQDDLPRFGKYRIDADMWASDSSLGLARFNLNSLLHSDRLRELIVDLVAPQWYTFNQKTIESTIERASTRVLQTQSSALATTSSPRQSQQQHGNLNSDQSRALNKVLSARDYALILGMPGTGKTTTIAAIVASLIERGKSVLVSAYTNSAVDTIVRKLLDAQQKCLRLVSSNYDTSTMAPEVADVAVSLSSDADNSKLVEFLGAPVVACTSHGTNNKIFALRQFDYCIMDEASQITLPFILGPLRLAPIFVLVGDHYQLPPLVRDQEARSLGMDQSLFKILCDAHPEAVVALTKQYRMCQDIMSLSSDLVYDGKLVAGNEVVANQQLEIRGWDFVSETFALHDALNPVNRVVFLDTDVLGPRAYEKQHEQGSSNLGEAKVIFNLVTTLSDLGVDMGECAVISVYRQQLALLNSLLQGQVQKGLEILTADQAQGRDKNCILVSLVKSNDSAQTGELLKDWRRLNVAFTRAKQKLVIVGSKRLMQKADGVSRFFSYIQSRKWVYPATLST